jgi:alanyl-tRNA synthetase
VDNAVEGEYVQVVTDQTPFYAESGGQIGDAGTAVTEGGAFTIVDTHKDSGYWFHIGSVTSGEINVGDTLDLKVDAGRRADIQRNHTSTHLLHKALQMVLGSHVQQRGSLVAPDRLRFDFAHDKSMTAEEVRKVENIVNDRILDDIEIRTAEKPIEEARKMGAMMLFGEKYGDIVRVVTAGDFSVEFCGGTHLRSTAQAGLFKIVSESSSQAGVRRIEAITGRAALRRVTDQEETLSDLTTTLKTSPANLQQSVAKLVTQVHELNKELQSFQKAAAGGQVEKLATAAETINGVSFVVSALPGSTDGEALKVLVDELLSRLKTGVVALGSVNDGKVSLAVKVSDDLLSKGLHAGKIVGQAAKEVDGAGGGRPNFAQAGGRSPEKLSSALNVAKTLISEALQA